MNSARLAPGELVGGRYQIEALLGEGGMAVVYRVRHVGTGRPCALKLVHAHLITRANLVEMFIREAQVGSKIGPNPHVVEVLDAAADEMRRVPYLVMELLEGQTLEQWSERNGPMHPAMVRDVFEQLGDALGQAHRAGVVHRDLKPSNLFLTTDHKGQLLLKVLDFGIAKVLEDDNQRTATQIGTPSYAAPEQFGAMFRPLAERQGIIIATNVSPATDVWAMGLIAYEMITGAKSGQYWDTQNLAELPLKAALGEHESASRRAGDRAALLPPGFDGWFARCLRKNAPERWPSAGHAISELTRLFAGFSSPAHANLATQQTASGPVIPTNQPATPPPPLGSGPFTPGPFVSGAPAPYPGPPAASYPPGPGTYPQGPYAPGPAPYTQQAPYGQPGYPPQAPAPYPPGPPMGGGYGQGYPAQGMPYVPPAPAKPPSSTAVWVAPLAVVGVILLSIVGTLGYYGVRRYRNATLAHECEKQHTHCAEACDASDLASCTRLATMLETGSGGTTRDFPKAVETYRKACIGGDQAGCASLGHLYLIGRGTDKDVDEGKRLVKKACDAGAQRGCALLGELVRDGDMGKADDSGATVLFQGACDAGDPVGCRDLGWMAETGRGGQAKSPSRAMELYKGACDGGDPGGCNHVAVLYESGKGTPKDLAKAAAVYQTACEMGEPFACSNLGMMNEFGTSMAKDEPRALTLYTQACDDGGTTGCARLGLMHEYGKGGLTKDPARAVTHYTQACDGGNAAGCFYLGTMEEAGKGTAQNEAKAAAHYKQACDGGNWAGCNGVGVMMEGGKGGLPKDEAKAAGMYKQACENGVNQACSNYGLMLSGGHGVAKDPVKSAQYFKQACDGDNSAGCSNLGYQYVNGLGLPRDKARGLELLRKGCAAGYQWGCDQLKSAGGAR